MPIPAKYLSDFQEHGVYHVYNRTSTGQLLFQNEENHFYFLRKYSKYLQPVLDTFCWNLQPNHFHLMVRVKAAAEITKAIAAKAGKAIAVNGQTAIQISENDESLTITEIRFLENKITLSEIIEHYFKCWFQAYSMAFNKANNHKGNLFYKPFKRIEIANKADFIPLVIYIHANAQKHRLCKSFTQYPWSSYHSILSNSATLLSRKEVLDLFGGTAAFVAAHSGANRYYYHNDYSIE